jgi:hypothetical protein
MSAAAPQKRNSGRTGPVTPEGRAISAQNSRKHGLCSQTLIQPGETMQDFLVLLKHWCQNYRAAEGHFLFEYVRQAAKAEWFRIRAQRQYNSCLEASPDPASKTRALLLRYKTAAECAFQRAFRALHQALTTRTAGSRPVAQTLVSLPGSGLPATPSASKSARPLNPGHPVLGPPNPCILNERQT